jgi:inner membrane protease ATP23
MAILDDEPLNPSTEPSTPTAPMQKVELDPAYYTWSNTFSIMLGRMTGNRDVNLEKNYFQEQDVVKAAAFCKRCEDNRDYLMKYSTFIPYHPIPPSPSLCPGRPLPSAKQQHITGPIVRFMSDEVYKLGGDLNASNILCRICTSSQSGGFHADHGIMLCANLFRNRGHQEDTMAHEMVHAWDHLKFKVEQDNLRHQACLEV